MGGKSGKGQSGGNGGSQGVHRGGSQPKYSPNDDRSIVKNNTSGAYAADQANQASQKTKGS